LNDEEREQQENVNQYATEKSVDVNQTNDNHARKPPQEEIKKAKQREEPSMDH